MVKINYIFIDPNNYLNNKIPDELMKIEEVYASSVNREIIFHTYPSLLEIIDSIDTSYVDLFSRINKKIPACIADVGRIAVLYSSGGIYHDLTFFIKNNDFLAKLTSKLNDAKFFFMRRVGLWLKSGAKNDVLMCCMASVLRNNLFLEILNNQFENLKRVDYEIRNNIKHDHNIWSETGITFYNTFKQKCLENQYNYNEHIIEWDISKKPRYFPRDENHWTNIQKNENIIKQ